MVGGLEVKFSLGTLLIWHLYSEKKDPSCNFWAWAVRSSGSCGVSP